ncbi:MAG: hypothetical protein J2P53_05720 [Bradyrhizobiaceae bacterium]|nr:hypothetical protein [Bradyrhizobiaceae bacterium]
MSASSGELYGKPPLTDGPLSGAPSEDAPEGGGRPQRNDNANDTAGRDKGRRPDQSPPAAAPRKRTKPAAFEGDIAIAELRTRLSASPDRLEDPPSSGSTASTLGGAWRVLPVIAAVIMGAAGYFWHPTPWTAPPHQTAPVSDRTASKDEAPNPGLNTDPGSSEPRLAGRPMGADSSANDTTAPRAAPVPLRRVNAAEIAMMMKQGELFMANADVSGARLVFQRAAEAGDAAAALALAETYDPLVLGKSGAQKGIIPDVAAARTWYKRARELGSAVAGERIARLAQLGE